MSTRLLELRRRRANLTNQARELVDAVENDANRSWNQEDQNTWDGYMADIDQLREQIEREERLQGLENLNGGDPAGSFRPDPQDPGATRSLADVEFQSRSLRHVVESDPLWYQDPAFRHLAAISTPEVVRAFGNYIRTGAVAEELRALQVDSDEAGGYLQTPLQLVDRLIKAIDDQVYMRQWATIFRVTAAGSLGAPSLDADPEDSDWTTEIGAVDEDTQMDFGRRELTPHPANKLVKVSNKMLRNVPMAENLVIDRLGYKHALTWEKAALTGSGAGQPLGVFTASGLGISTGRDVSTDNTSTAVTVDGLINAKYTLKGQYWPRARWLAHRDFYKMVAKLKDGNGQYLWQPSVQAGQPDKLLNVPAFMSEYAPNTFTTGLYVGIIGDFSLYWIADSLNFQIQRLVELYAANRQTGFIGEFEGDGMPVLEEAFVRVALA